MKPDRIPTELRERPQWLVWKIETPKGRKPTKLPFQVNGDNASSTDPATWTTFDSAYRCWQAGAGGYSGIGFVFALDDPYCGIDLDGCRDPKSGTFADWARAILLACDSYAEVSPSMTGAKLFVRGKLPWDSGKNVKVPGVPKVCDKEPGIEMYEHGRYFAVTGLRLSGKPGICTDQQALVDRLAATYGPPPITAAGGADWYAEAAVIERARKYLAKLPPAVDGKNGSGACYRAACVLTLGFGLPEGQALDLMREYNQTCVPPWSEKELVHKVKSSLKEPGTRNYLRTKREQDWDSTDVPEYREAAPGTSTIESPPNVLTLRSAAENYLTGMREGKTTLFETGLPDVDSALGGGLEPGEMVVLAARPSHGKSAVALQVIHYTTALGVPAVMVSEEMSPLALGKRTIQFASNVPEEHWRTSEPKVTRQVQEHFDSRAECYVVESCRTVERADVAIREAVDKHGCKLAVVDYAQLLGGRGRSRYEQITATSIALRQLASQTKVVLLVLCQLSRAIETRNKFVPVMSDLKDTGQLEQDADVILFLCWPHKLDAKNNPKEFQFFIGKNRNRAVVEPMVECSFEPSRQMLVLRKPDMSQYADPLFTPDPQPF